MSAWWLLLAYFLFALAYFAVGFFPDRQLVGTDQLAAGYFFNEFVRERFAAGSLPKWVPYIFGGLPHYANPGGTYYPPRLLLALALPPERAMVALFVVQLTAAGIGTYLFLRHLAIRWWVAALGGLAYEFTGLTLSFVYAGHDGRIIAATMLPLVLLAVSVSLETGAARWFAALAATTGALLLSFQIQAAYYVLLASAGWGLYVLGSQVRRTSTLELVRRTVLGLTAIALAFALAGVNFLPFARYVAESPRASAAVRGYEFATSFSMPPGETVGLAIPEWHGALDSYRGISRLKYHTEYAGAFVLLLALLGLPLARRDGRWRFFAGLGVFALVMAWGGHTPLYRLYYELLPGISRFRAPSIGLFLVSFSLVVLAALGLERLAVRRQQGDANGPRRIASLALLGSVMLLIAGAAGGTAPLLGVARFGAFLALVAGLLWLWLADTPRVPQRVIIGALALVVVVDLALIGRRFVLTVAPPDELMVADDVVRFLQAQQPSRVWVLPAPPGSGSGYLGNRTFGVHTDYLMHFKLRQMGGEHGNQLQRWNEYAGGSAATMIDFSNLTNRTALVDAASIDYIVANVQLVVVSGTRNTATDRLEQVYENGSVLIYRNRRAMPRAYLSPVVHLVPTRQQALAKVLAELWDPRDSTFVEVGQGAAPPSLERTPLVGKAVVETSDDPDKVVIRTEASRPALLVLTEAFAEGWEASIDGNSVPIRAANYAFRSVVVPGGAHQVTFAFTPRRLQAGVRMSLVALVVLLLWAAWGVVSGRSRERMDRSILPDARKPPANAEGFR